MCLKKLKNVLSLEKYTGYKTEKLYIGLLGYVTKDAKKIYINSDDKKIIIYKKVMIDDWYKEYGAQDIFTNKIYFFWSGNNFDSETICRAVGNYAVHRSLPLEHFLTTPKSKTSHSELLALYNELNHPKKELPKETPKIEPVPITDNILKTILETNELVKNTIMEQETKDKIIKELEELGEYYVNEMIKVNEKTSNALTLEDEYSIRINVIKRLAEIETTIQNPNLAKNHSLKKQLTQFQKDLNNN